LAAAVLTACGGGSSQDLRQNDAGGTGGRRDGGVDAAASGGASGGAAGSGIAESDAAAGAGAGGATGTAGAGGAPDGGAGLDGGASSDAGGTSDGGDAGSDAALCGFVMPNPASSGLPNPASYDTSVAGIVTDKVTGLSWQRVVAGQPASEGCTTNVTGLLYCPLRYAAEYCAASRLGGFSDWRLPTVLELISLVDFTQWYPAIDGLAFPDTPYEVFWSSTRKATRPDLAWQVAFSYGTTWSAFIDQPAHVRCVRTGGAPPPRCAPAGGRYQLTSTLATDTLTGLTWLRGVAAPESSPANAATLCSGMGQGSRIPSIKELYTLLDFGVNPSVALPFDLNAFQRPQSYFWSSTAVIGGYMSVWVLDVQDGGTVSTAGLFDTLGASKCVR
jgi:hypothetical protein